MSSFPSKPVQQDTETRQIGNVTNTFQTEIQAENSPSRQISLFLTPISRLPTELLGYIFEDFVELNQSPWLLTTINRHWRDIALATPVLWAHIYVCGVGDKWFSLKYVDHDVWTVYGSTLIYRGMYKICRTIEEVESMVSRTAAAQLDIKYTNNANVLDQKALAFTITTYSSRIRSLDISSPIHTLSQDLLHLPELPALKQLSLRLLDRKRSQPFATAILLSAPGLESLVMDAGDDLLLGHSLWGSLRVLQLDEKPPCINQLNGTVSMFESLEVLKGCPLGWPNALTPQSTLMHITSITLSCQPQYLSHVELPALQALDWNVPVESKTQAADPYLQSWSTNFPQLADLKVAAPNALWLSRLSLPNLRTFSWTKTVLSPGACPPFPKVRLDSVEKLVCDAICDDDVFISALECTPNVQTVVFAPGTSMKYPEDWGRELLNHIAKNSLVTHPELRHITLGIGDHLVATKRAALKPTIEKIIKSRKDSGLPIQNFEVIWKRNRKMETVQYV